MKTGKGIREDWVGWEEWGEGRMGLKFQRLKKKMQNESFEGIFKNVLN